MPKPLTVWITTNWKILKEKEYQTTLPASWEICMQVKKQQLKQDMEQQTCSKLGKEYVEAIYCHPAYLAYMQSSAQFSSVTQSCLTLCDPMDNSTPGFPVHHQLPEPAQTRVHRVSDAMQPSHPLSRKVSTSDKEGPKVMSFLGKYLKPISTVVPTFLLHNKLSQSLKQVSCFDL